MKTRQRWAAVLGVALWLPLCACTGLTEAAGSGSQGSDGLLGYGQINDEYLDATAELQLPPGIAFPANMTSPEEQTMYEAGAGKNVAERFWICSWERRWLDQNGRSSTESEAALEVLRSARSTHFMSVSLDDAGRRLYDEYLTKASLGDASGIEQDVNQNC